MKKKTFLLILFLIADFFWGQIKGVYLLNECGGSPISGATIKNEKGNFTQTSDEFGFVSLTSLPENTEKIFIHKLGFEDSEILISNLKTTDKAFPAISLISKITSIAEISLSSVFQKGLFKTLNDLDIHLRPINNSQEVLRMVPGLFIGQHAGGGKAEQIFLRGFDLDHGTDINISVDGLPVNMVSHAHGQGYADLHFVIPELINQVDFNKGPYFANKGNFTTAGFVEFMLKNFLDRDFIKLETGQFNSYRGVFGVNLLPYRSSGKRNESLYFSGEAFFTKGYFDHPQDFNRLNGILKYFGKVGENTTVSSFVSAFSSKWNASGQIPERSVNDGTIGFYGAIDPNEGGKTSRYNFNVETVSRLNNGGQLKNQIFYSKYLFELFSNFTFFKIDPVNGDQIKQKENRDLMGINSSYQKSFSLGNVKTETTFGIQSRYDIINRSELSRTLNRNTRLQSIIYGNIKELNSGAFYSQKMSLTEKLDITGGIRFDVFYQNFNNLLENNTLSSTSSIWSPKLNIDYRLNDKIHLY